MSTESFAEQLTRSISFPMLTIALGTVIAFILLYAVAYRLFSSSKSKIVSESQSTKAKNPKESHRKKQRDITTSNKKKNNKRKKNVTTTSSSLPNTQSEESENEKLVLAEPPKKVFYF